MALRSRVYMPSRFSPEKLLCSNLIDSNFYPTPGQCGSSVPRNPCKAFTGCFACSLILRILSSVCLLHWHRSWWRESSTIIMLCLCVLRATMVDWPPRHQWIIWMSEWSCLDWWSKLTKSRSPKSVYNFEFYLVPCVLWVVHICLALLSLWRHTCCQPVIIEVLYLWPTWTLAGDIQVLTSPCIVHHSLHT